MNRENGFIKNPERNLNTIRSITLDHGSPIDQYEVLARSATKQAFMERTLVNKLYVIPSRMYFEIRLIKIKFNMWVQRVVLQILNLLGWSIDLQFLKQLNS